MQFVVCFSPWLITSCLAALKSFFCGIGFWELRSRVSFWKKAGCILRILNYREIPEKTPYCWTHWKSPGRAPGVVRKKPHFPGRGVCQCVHMRVHCTLELHLLLAACTFSTWGNKEDPWGVPAAIAALLWSNQDPAGLGGLGKALRSLPSALLPWPGPECRQQTSLTLGHHPVEPGSTGGAVSCLSHNQHWLLS